MKKPIDPDIEYNLYKVTYLWVDSYCVATDTVDAVSSYEEVPGDITKVEYIGVSYLWSQLVNNF